MFETVVDFRQRGSEGSRTPLLHFPGRVRVDHNSLRRTPHGWAEDAPTRCPQGHHLGPNQVLVGSRNCQCGTMHRTHTCRQCDSVVYTPPLTADCTPSDGGRSTFTWTQAR